MENSDMMSDFHLRPAQRSLLKTILAVAGTLLLLAVIFRNRWPDQHEFLPELFQEPVQIKTHLPPPFDVTQNGYVYTVYPLFAYELWGMVVSSHYAGSFIDYAHRMWKDYLNIKDLCVIWGKNLETGAFRKMKFWSRDFICYYSWSDAETGRQFSSSHFANNHLLTDNPRLRRIIKGVKRGDQIHFRGWLARYGHKGSDVIRGTSTTRYDTGNQSCETVFVQEFEILRKANPIWRAAIPVALLFILFSLLLLVFF